MEHRGGEDALTEEAARRTLKWRMAKASFARLRFGSSKATAPANLVYPSRKTARKIAAPLA